MRYPVMERKYKRGVLTIKVRYQAPSMKCTVVYGLSSIDLPRHIDELRGWLRGITDINDTERTYKMIKKEVNDMLREYQLEYNTDSPSVEQFDFPEIPNTTIGIRDDIHIQIGATPTWSAPVVRECRAERYVPQMEYLSAEAYEEKRKAGELESGTVYCVLN